MAACWLVHLHSTGDHFWIAAKTPDILPDFSMIFFSPFRNMTGVLKAEDKVGRVPTMKAYGDTGIAPLILNFGTTCR